MPFWIPVATTSVAAGIFIAVDILASRRERANAKREAAARFSSAMAEALTQLDNIDAHAQINGARVQHDEAIAGFRPLVDLKKIQRFDAAVRKFHQGRSELKPGPEKVLASLSSGRPVDQSDVLTLKNALHELLAFAGNN